MLRAVQSPLIAWIWIGTAILAFGTAYTLLPAPRRQKRRVTAAAAEGVPETVPGARV